MSSLLRAEAVSMLDVRPARLASFPSARVIGGRRLLPSEQVGLETPRSLRVVNPVVAVEPVPDEVEEFLPPPPPPDFAAIEEAARLQGYNLGYEEGLAAGHAAAEQTTAAAVERLSRLVATIVEEHAGFFRAAERQVVDLALQIAQKVVEREVENMPDLAVNVIRGALEEMDARTAVRVRVSPDDVELLRRRWPQVVPPGIGHERIELQADERIQSGGAVIETTQGQVDAQLQSKLEQLGNALWTFVMDEHANGSESISA